MIERGLDTEGPAQPKGLDARYFAEAVRWENDVIRTVKRSRTIAWVVAGASAILAGLAMACLVMLLPLKSFEAYVVEVDKTTGFMEIKQPLAEGELTQSEAITRMNVVRYVKARETYDPTSVQNDFDLAQLLSTGDASRDLTNLYGPSSPTNPVNRYGRQTRVLPTIKSIQIPNNRTAIVPILDTAYRAGIRTGGALGCLDAFPLFACADDQ